MSYKHISLENITTFAAQIKAKYATQTALEALQTKVNNLVAAGGEPNVLEGVKVNGTALTIAEKMVDILIATGSTNGTISVNNAEVAIAGLQALAFKAQVSESDLDTALAAVISAKASGDDLTALTTRVTANETAITTLNGTGEGSVTKQVADAVALIVADAPEAYDTLKEISDWISSHASDAAAMNSQINTNKSDIAALTSLVGTLPEGATSTTVVAYIAEAIGALGIGDYAKTTEVTSAINTALADYYTKTEIDTTLAGYVKTSDIETVTEAEILALFADDEEADA